MALVGNLKDFGLADLLYLVDRGYKTGMLVLRRSDDEVGLFFDNGKLVSATENGTVGPLDDEQSGIEETVYWLFSWTDGDFRFEPDVKPPAESVATPLSIEKVVTEGVRRLDEWARIRERIPTLDVAVRFTEQTAKRPRGVNLTSDEWRVFTRINRAENIAAIARLARMSEFDVCRIIYGFMQAGLVEVTPAQMVRS